MKFNPLQAQWSREDLQKFADIIASNKKFYEDIIIFFRQIYLKSESQGTAKHTWHKLTSDSNKKIFNWFPEGGQGVCGKSISEQHSTHDR